MILTSRLFACCDRPSWYTGVSIRICFLLLFTQTWSPALGDTTQLGNFTVIPGFGSSNFEHVYDLTTEDVSISYSIDLSGVTKDSEKFGPFIEIGLREEGAENINPGIFGVHPGGKGGWMISAVEDLTTTESAFDVDDKHNLQSAGDLDETKYDAVDPSTITTPFGTLVDSQGILFDRDGVGVGEDASHAKTLGKYEIKVDFHAVGADIATMFATVNGLSQGFSSNSFEPAGVGFTGDMTRMQVFLGSLMADGTGTIQISDLSVVTSAAVPEPIGWWPCIFGFYFLATATRRRMRSFVGLHSAQSGLKQ